MVTIAQIYDWFMTGKKPTQAQFWASWGSFWNKLEQIPQSAIAGLTTVLNAKAEKAQFDAHKTDTAAHAALFDAKEDKTQKGVAGGYVPLDEFVKIANEYLTIVNDLVTGGATSLASAETVKTLKTQIDAINTLLTSNDVNLDTVQEIIDAIKTVQTSLSTILVNDLTTGGTTKALTAEMGKTLKGLIDEFYANSTIDTLLAGKANQILALKTITGTTYNVIYDDISNELVYEGTVAMNVIIPNNATLALPIGTVFYSVATNTGILSVSGGAGVVFQTAVGLSGAQNEVRKYTKRGINTWGVEGNVTSSSDMILASTQTVSGLKTFLNGVFGLRNVANTFTSFFTNANTASRTYTLPDRSGTLADNTDIASINTGKMNTPAGTVNYLSKFLTATTIGLSRLFDNGTYFGIGTANPPTKDFTLGNQLDRSIGIENSSSIVKGRDLTIEAGKTINYLENADLIRLGTSTYSGFSICKAPNGDFYAGARNTGIMRVPLSTTDVLLYSGADIYISEVAVTYNLNMFASQDAGFTRKNGVAQTWFSSFLFASRFTNKLYVIIGGVLKYTTDDGATFTNIQTVSLKSNMMSENSVGDVFFLTGGYLWKQTGGTGLFVNTNIPLLGTYITCLNNNDIISASSTKLYRLTYGNTVATEIKTISIAGSFGGFNSDSNDRLMFASGEFSTPQPYYIMETNSVGTANLNGGTLKLKAGTGKGTGASKIQLVTGAKTVSGTDMQVETVRAEIDEQGVFKLNYTPTYADNTAALSGGLTAGMFYRTSTGILMIVY